MPGDVAWVPMSRFFFFSYHSRSWLEEVGTEWHHQIHVKDIATYRPNWPNGPIQWQLCAKKNLFSERKKKLVTKNVRGKKSYFWFMTNRYCDKNMFVAKSIVILSSSFLGVFLQYLWQNKCGNFCCCFIYSI